MGLKWVELYPQIPKDLTKVGSEVYTGPSFPVVTKVTSRFSLFPDRTRAPSHSAPLMGKAAAQYSPGGDHHGALRPSGAVPDRVLFEDRREITF